MLFIIIAFNFKQSSNKNDYDRNRFGVKKHNTSRIVRTENILCATNTSSLHQCMNKDNSIPESKYNFNEILRHRNIMQNDNTNI